MKKLRNMHPLKEIVVQGESITLGFLLTIGQIGAESPIEFVSANVHIPRPIIIRCDKYRGKIGKKKVKR